MLLGMRHQLDHAIHFSGGLAIAYFLYRSIKIISPVIGFVTPLTRFLLSFTAACTVALFWEFGEFASDLLRGTRIQHSVHETLWDLVFGTAGALLSLLIIALLEGYKSRTRQLT